MNQFARLLAAAAVLLCGACAAPPPQTLSTPTAAASSVMAASEATCKPGQVVSEKSDPDLFQIQVLAAPNVPSVQDILRAEGFVKGVMSILSGMRNGSIPRIDRDSNSTVLIEGVGSQSFPKRLSYLGGDDVCQQGTLEVIPHGRGVLVVLPTLARNKGQGALVMKRAVAASASRICTEAPYPIFTMVENGKLTTGKLNCSNTGAATLARKGISSALFLLAQAQ